MTTTQPPDHDEAESILWAGVKFVGWFLVIAGVASVVVVLAL